jgi:Ca2+-binding EF-hand superfamily protein
MSQTLKSAFDRVDLDSDGRIDFSELLSALDEITERRVSQEDMFLTMKAMDADGDGRITFEEFVRVMRSEEDVGLMDEQ